MPRGGGYDPAPAFLLKNKMNKSKDYIEAIRDVISILERRREECLIISKKHTSIRFEYRAKADELQLTINDINKNLK